MTNFHDPGGPSGTFGALDRNPPALVLADDDGIATTTSLIVAAGTEAQHESVINLVRSNLADFEEFGIVRFEIGKMTAGPGRPTTYAVLNEQHATLLLTYMRNSTVVKDFKKRLVHEFYALRRVAAAPLTGPELFAHAVLEAQAMLAAKDEQIAILAPKAEIADRLLDAEGDLSVGDTAQALTRAGIKTGRGRMFATLEGKTWIYRSRGDGRYRVNQRAIDAGWMSVLPQTHYHPKSGELVLDPPQPRVTPKGLQRLLVDLSGVTA